MRRHDLGFSLIELLVALAITAMLIGLASRAYASVLAATRSGNARASLHNALISAQRGSVVHNKHVVLCASTDGAGCSGSDAWETGWIGFVDLNRDRAAQSGEPVILRESAIHGEIRIRTSSNRLRLVFQPNGGAAAGSNVTFVICDARGPADASALILANSGRLRQGIPSSARARQACQ